MTFIQGTMTRVGMGDNPSRCALCDADLGEFRYRPMYQWNISGMLCSHCYDKKLLEHYIAPDRRDVTKR
jgi:recombinational DNA repair protein (RecF pathway)